MTATTRKSRIRSKRSTSAPRPSGASVGRGRRTQVELAAEAEAKYSKEKSRMKLDVLKLRRASLRGRRKMLSIHRAAEQNRFTADWIAPMTSADSSILPDLLRVNARARQMVRDDPYARAIVRSFRRNVVGTGITPSIDDKAYRSEWRRWAGNAANVDIEKRRNLVQIQQWGDDELITVGESFTVRWIIGGKLVLQCFESEQLDRYKLIEYSTGNEVRGGVEVDEHNAPVAYHFYRRHPHDVRGMARPAPLSLESMRVPANMVSHIYDPDRVLQTRGISRLAPVLRKIRDLSEYDATQLRVARAEASIGLLITGAQMDENGDATDPLELDGLNVAHLAEGEDVKTFAPSRPGREYEPFTKQQLRAIATGVGLSYEQLARDLSQTTYSGGRQGTIDDHREYEPLQQLLITQLCKPVFEDWLFVWAMANPELSGDYFLRDDSDEVQWQGQGWDWVDPEAQGKSIERKMVLGLTNRTIECNLLGRTPEQIDREAATDGTLEIIKRLTKTNGRDGRENPAPPGSTAESTATSEFVEVTHA